MKLKNNRLTYFYITVTVIIFGILSRKFDGFPTFLGDTLYAVMVFFGIRLIFKKQSQLKTVLLAFVFCYCIEFFQLYKADWIVAIRRTTLGHYALGQGFLWSDLFFYSIGVIIAYLIDINFVKKQ